VGAGITTDDDWARDVTISATKAERVDDAGAITEDIRRGTLLGRYVVLERIGAGGMGVVYAALDPELGRQVAVKLVRSSIDSRMGDTEHVSAGAVRLLREAQAMARLHHPNVIAVHDVGTVGGRVFIAMAYLDGGTLGEWLEREHPAWSDALPRFLAAGAGLAAAHAAGIVHRDFKSDNVLLGQDGRVCVVDFGLARASELDTTRDLELERASTDSFDTKLTRTGALMGTPAYMSPEQHAGGLADARSDQFSFCVALYEACYRQRPFPGENAAALAAAVLDGRLRPPPEGNATPRWLFAVLARGLSVRPHERWPDMDALLAALRDDPTVRRRRRARQSLVAALVVGGAGLSLAYAQHRAELCTHADEAMTAVWSSEARAAASKAFAESGRAHALLAWRRTEAELDDWATRWVDAHTEACRATSVRGEQSQDMLDRRMSCLDQRLQEAVAVLDVLTTADAAAVDNASKLVAQIGDVAMCGDTDALLADVSQPAASDRAEVDDIRTQLARAKVFRTGGRYHGATEVVAELDARVRALDYAPLTAEYLFMRAATELDQGRPADGEAHLYEAAREAAAADYQAFEPQIWIALVRVVGTHVDRPLELPPLVKSAEIAVVRAGSTPADRGALALVVGTQALLRGEYTDAEPRLQEAVALLGEVRGVDHPDTIEAREMLALTLHGRQRYDEAQAALEGIAEAIVRTQGDTHPSLASVLANLSRIHAARGDLELARTSAETALRAIVAAFGPEHHSVATAHSNLATTCRKLGRYEEAAAHTEAALVIERKLFGAESPRIASTIHGRGQLALARGDARAALDDYREALRIWEITLGPQHARTAYALTGVGKAELVLDRPDAAIEALERALAVREAAKDVSADDLAETRFVLAKALRAAGRDPARSLALADQARSTFAQLEADEDVREIDEWRGGR
jgi:eukaryotic-like serine/threonine-protein kinase